MAIGVKAQLQSRLEILCLERPKGPGTEGIEYLKAINSNGYEAAEVIFKGYKDRFLSLLLF